MPGGVIGDGCQAKARAVQYAHAIPPSRNAGAIVVLEHRAYFSAWRMVFVSPSVMSARQVLPWTVEWANRHGLKTFGCTGFTGGKLRTAAQHNFHVPLEDMGIVESIHLTAFHWIVDDLYRRISLQPNS